MTGTGRAPRPRPTGAPSALGTAGGARHPRPVRSHPSAAGRGPRPPGPHELEAHTTPLPPDGHGGEAVDLLAVAGEEGFLLEQDGTGLAGRGVALRLELPRGIDDRESLQAAVDALAAIPVQDEVDRPGTGPVAVAALPFDATAPASLVVPALVVGRDASGRAWRTTVRPRRGAAIGPAGETTLAPAAPRGGEPPRQFRVVASCPQQEWCERVATAVRAIRAGDLEKAVLAREVVVEADRPLSGAAVVDQLRSRHPACTTFSVEGFVGASPELLASRRGGRVRSHPLAGTVARSDDPAADAALAAGLRSSAKDVHEHRMVVEAVADGLAGVCARLEVPAQPSVVPLREVSHLGTLVEGDLAPPGRGGRPPSALELAARLHPTPAVAGTPRAGALALIARLEGLDRGRYAGPVGWVDRRGNGDWVVGIRSATLAGATARLLAGVGIVEDSDPAAELAETELKLQALLGAIVGP